MWCRATDILGYIHKMIEFVTSQQARKKVLQQPSRPDFLRTYQNSLVMLKKCFHSYIRLFTWAKLPFAQTSK